MATENPTAATPEPKKPQGKQAEGGAQARAPEQKKATQGGEEARKGGGLSRREPSLPALRAGELWAASPLSLMRRMMDEFERFFDETGLAGGMPGRGTLPGALARGGAWAPQVDVFEREGNLVVRADLPGLTKDDIRVEVTEDALVLEGEREREDTEEKGGWYRSERSYGSFRRVVPLPEGVSAEGADARFDNGVLEVTMPLPKERERAKRIEVREGGEKEKSVH